MLYNHHRLKKCQCFDSSVINYYSSHWFWSLLHSTQTYIFMSLDLSSWFHLPPYWKEKEYLTRTLNALLHSNFSCHCTSSSTPPLTSLSPAAPLILLPAFLPFFYCLSLTSFPSSFLIPFSFLFLQESRNRKKKKTKQWSIRRQSHEFGFQGHDFSPWRGHLRSRQGQILHKPRGARG